MNTTRFHLDDVLNGLLLATLAFFVVCANVDGLHADLAGDRAVLVAGAANQVVASATPACSAH